MESYWHVAVVMALTTPSSFGTPLLGNRTASHYEGTLVRSSLWPLVLTVADWLQRDTITPSGYGISVLGRRSEHHSGGIPMMYCALHFVPRTDDGWCPAARI